MMKKIALFLIPVLSIVFSACAGPGEGTELPAYQSNATAADDGSALEDARSAGSIPEADGSGNISLEDWENAFPEREDGTEEFENYLYDATGLYTGTDLASVRSLLREDTEGIARQLFENYDSASFMDNIRRYIAEDSRIIDISLEPCLEKIPDAFADEQVNMEITDVRIDYLQTFFTAVTGLESSDVLYEQANAYAVVSLHGSSKDLTEGDYTVLLSLHFDREPLKAQEWKLTYIGGDFFYVVDNEGARGYIETTDSQGVVHYDGNIVDNWSVIQ